MAQLSLKNTTMKIKDGYSGPSATAFKVNNMGGYMAGATTMVIDTGTGEIETGDLFTVVGDDVIHTVTAHSETSMNTTSITFTPALGANVADNADITILPHEITIKIGEGTISYTEKRNMVYTRDRGMLETVRDGDEEPMDVKIDAIWEFITASTGDAPTIEDALKQRGEAADWVTSAADACEPYAVDIVIEYTPPCTGEDIETITLPDFRWESIDHDLKQATFSISGKCNALEAIAVRTAP